MRNSTPRRRPVAQADAPLDSIPALMSAIDALRVKAGVSKAELARRTGMRSEVMRRLFTTAEPNPTLATILGILRAIGYSLALVPAGGAGRAKPKGKDG